MRKKCPERTPGAHVTPAEIRRESIYIVRLLHHGIVNRNLLACREDLSHNGSLAVGKERRCHLIHLLSDRRSKRTQRLHDSRNIPDEDTGIPEIIAGSQILLGHLQRRFLAERLHRADLRTLKSIQSSDISIAGLRTRRLDAKGDDTLALCSKVQGLADNPPELLHIQHQSIGRSHNNICRRILLLDLPAGIGNARRCVACTRLSNDVLHRNLRQLLTHHSHIRLAGHHPEIRHRADAGEPLHGHLDHSPATAHHIDELLRIFRCTHRPEPAADTTCHYNNMITHKCCKDTNLEINKD